MGRDLPAVFRGENGEKPSTPARDARGRFVAGASPGPGRPVNPFGRYQRELRLALAAEVTPADLQAVIRQVVRLAKRGSIQATEVLLKWLLGGPPPALDPDKLDAHEREVRTGRLTMLDHLALADQDAEALAEEAEEEAPAEAEEAPDDPRAPTGPPLRTVLAWAIEELAEARYALRAQPPPPDPAQGWARFAEQRLEFDEQAAVEVDALYLAYAKWCASHGEPVWAEDQVLAALEARGVTLRTGTLLRTTMLVGVRLVA